jgi:putative hydrolase of the HAD superfamily
MQRIKSVIFDWGGVLIDNPAPGLMQYCSRALGVSSEDYEKVHEMFSPDFQKGFINEDTFWKRVCGELNVTVPLIRSLWIDAFRGVYYPRKEMFGLVASLQNAGYKTAILSNTEAPAMACFNKAGYEIFDAAVFSCEVACVKPERRIYEITLQKLECQPNESVFIDDKPEYINGARQVGIKTILYEDTQQVKKALADFGVEWSE